MVLHPEKGQGAECGSPIFNVVFFPVDHVPLEGWKLRKNGTSDAFARSIWKKGHVESYPSLPKSSSHTF